MGLEDALLGERGQTQRTTALRDSTSRTHRGRIRLAVARGWEEGQKGSDCTWGLIWGGAYCTCISLWGTHSLVNLGTVARTSALHSGTILNNDINTKNKGEKYGTKWTEKRQLTV